jgi:hypothetical protein
MASAVVSMGPEPEKLAMKRAAAHTVVERVILKIILRGLSGLVRRCCVRFADN